MCKAQTRLCKHYIMSKYIRLANFETGPYKLTSITEDFRQVEVDSFERIAFYVTLSSPNMRYTKLDEAVLSVGDSVYDLSDVRILAGSGIKGKCCDRI
jgi:hypothetical protein